MDVSVIRVSHCGHQIFCVSVPAVCPSCGQSLSGTRLSHAPVSVPSPFTNGHMTQCCLLIGPAATNTNRDFNGTSDLHTGISNTAGVVYSYTETGVNRDITGWDQCVSVPLVRPDCFPLLDQWDRYIQRFSEGNMWDIHWTRYHPEDHNCYSFCLGFINSVCVAERRPSWDRQSFTQTFILPKVRRAAKYSALTHAIHTQQYYVVEEERDGKEGGEREGVSE